jgi:hypothetical protein
MLRDSRLSRPRPLAVKRLKPHEKQSIEEAGALAYIAHIPVIDDDKKASLGRASGAQRRIRHVNRTADAEGDRRLAG